MQATQIDSTEQLRALYDTMFGRTTPEAVARLISEISPDAFGALTVTRKRRSKKAVVAVETDWYANYMSQMPTDFNPVSSLVKPANVLATLLGLDPITEEQGRDPEVIRTLTHAGRQATHMSDGRWSFKNDRMDRAGRKTTAAGELSRRRYNKLFRLIARLDQYSIELWHQNRMFNLGRFAKTGFASRISWEVFSADVPTACFVAYYTANLGRRSMFTNGKQARAFDKKAEILFNRIEPKAGPQWFAVGAVLPRQDVLQRLTETDRYRLLEWTQDTMQQAGAALKEAAEKNDVNRATMIVKAGNDSSTWNAAAGAWNRARDFWIALMVSMNAASTFEEFLPGKVMRLMAADVAYWHQATGGKLDDNTHVWSLLPAPWEVLDGTKACGLAEVEEACRRAKVNPQKTGWSDAREWKKADTWRPTLDSVHGIGIASPELATFLRRVGVFSGKGLKAMDIDEVIVAAQAWEENVVRIEATV